MYKLSVVITYHNEDTKLIHPLFSCLNLQKGVDWNNIEILFSNNCIEPNDIRSFLNKYTNIYSHIKFIYPNVKDYIGLSRQYAIDQATGDYIMFCDCDDILGSCMTLYEILGNIQTGADVYDIIEVEEVDKDGAITFTSYQINPIYVHGKIYSLPFLRANNIRFHEKLKTYEDNYFCFICDGCNPRRQRINSLGYVWKNNPNSVSRRDGGKYAEENWADAFMRIYYIYHFMTRYHPTQEGDVWTALYECIPGWYITIHETYKDYLNLSDIEELFGFYINTIDPQLNFLAKENCRPSKEFDKEAYDDWIKRITANIDIEKIRTQYQIDDM